MNRSHRWTLRTILNVSNTKWACPYLMSTYVLLDSDQPGIEFKRKLINGQYEGQGDKIVSAGDFTKFEFAEIEDLIPVELLVPVLGRMFRSVEAEYFEDIHDPNKPIVSQIEDFAAKHKVELEKGWKVDLARHTKSRILNQGSTLIDEETAVNWQKLFEAIYPQTIPSKDV